MHCQCNATQRPLSIFTFPKRGLAYLTPTKVTLIKSKHVLFFSLQFQIPSACTIYHPLISKFLGISKSFQLKYRQNAPFTFLVFILFSIVPNRFKLHQSTCFRDIVFLFSLQFKIVSNTVKMYESTKAYM